MNPFYFNTAALAQIEIQPEVLNFGAVGIIALALLALARAITPVTTSLGVATKALGQAASEAIQQQTRTTDIIAKNTIALDGVLDYLQSHTAAMNALTSNIGAQHMTALNELGELRTGITDGIGASEQRIITAQQNIISPLATTLTEIRDEMRARNEREDTITPRLNEVIRQLERLQIPALPAPAPAPTETPTLEAETKNNNDNLHA